MTTFQVLEWWWLPLALLAPLAWWRWWSPRRRVSVSYSSRGMLPAAGASAYGLGLSCSAASMLRLSAASILTWRSNSSSAVWRPGASSSGNAEGLSSGGCVFVVGLLFVSGVGELRGESQ